VDDMTARSTLPGTADRKSEHTELDDDTNKPIVDLPLESLQPGDSPRLDGLDKAHIMRLAEAESPFPPILVDRCSMRVIDGMHRLQAACLKGSRSINAVYFDGDEKDVFLRAVQDNVLHGLPLSKDDRQAAAARILATHPALSDRAIAQIAGLSARTVATIRKRSTGTVPQLSARVGQDGRVRPVNSTEGRQRAAELLAENPRASLREIARNAGVSWATARDVRSKMTAGKQAPPAPASASDDAQPPPGRPAAAADRGAVSPAPSLLLNKLSRDPSLRHNEQGRRLLRLLQQNIVETPERLRLADAVPSHCRQLVEHLARHHAKMWLDFAHELDERARLIYPWDTELANGQK
jgi:AraC-like DNA-binding protein